ncbi:hypothetical protein AB0H29_18400 [Streptomyces thermolilacinus]
MDSPNGSGAAPHAQDALLVDITRFARTGARESGHDWTALQDLVLPALKVLDRPDARLPDGAVRVHLVDLLDDEVDIGGRRGRPAGGGKRGPLTGRRACPTGIGYRCGLPAGVFLL